MSRFSTLYQNTFFVGPMLLASLLSIAGGCAKEYTDYKAFIQTPRPMVTANAYRLSPPDTIAIYSKRVKEISGHHEMIRPDGRITLPLLGSVFVAGKTPEQASHELEQLASKYYEDADVSLRVTGFNSKKIFVFGEVSNPGPYQYNGANTVLQTLAAAQPTRLADPTHIQILRPNASGKLIKRMTVDLNKMVKKGDTALDAVLSEGDILYIPPTALASVGLVIQQLLLPLQPAAATVNAPVQMGTSASSYPFRGSPRSATNNNF